MHNMFQKKRKKIFLFSVLFTFTLIFLFLYEKNHLFSITGTSSQEIFPTETSSDYIVFSNCLDTGSYTCDVTINSQSSFDWQLIDADHNNGNNQLGITITSGSVTAGSDHLSFDFILNKKTDHLNLVFHTSESSINASEWILTSTASSHTDFFIFIIVTLAFYLFLYFESSHSQGMYHIVSVCFGILLTTPYFTGSLYYGDDIRFHLNRILGIADGLSNGQFPVRMDYTINNGYGFINPILYPDLFLYLPAFLYLLGVSVLNAYKLFILLINIAAVCVGFYSFRRILKNDTLGFLCTFFYVLIPYRIVNLYTRAAISEVLATVFLPLLFLAVKELFFGNPKKWYLSVIAATCILQSHILSAEICLFFVLAVTLFRSVSILRSREFHRILYAFKALLFCILLNLWFIIPFLSEFGKDYFVIIRRPDLTEDTPSLWQLFFSFQDSYYNKTISLGFAVLAGTLIYIFYRYYKNAYTSSENTLGFYCLLFGGFSCYMVTEFFPWRLIQSTDFGNRYIAAMQFPWRMLSYASLFLCILISLGIKKLFEYKKSLFATGLCLLSLISAITCFDNFISKADIYIADRDSAIPGCNYADYYRFEIGQALEKIIPERGDMVHTSSQITISDYKKTWGKLSFDFKNNTSPLSSFTLSCPYYAYGYYKVTVNGTPYTYEKDEYDLMTIRIPDGMEEGSVVIQYTGRKLFSIGDIISLTTLILLLFTLFRNRRKTLSRQTRRPKNGVQKHSSIRRKQVSRS